MVHSEVLEAHQEVALELPSKEVLERSYETILDLKYTMNRGLL